MNVFYEFHKVAKMLHAKGVSYALIGGVAMAFHAKPRFTKDIDLLVTTEALDEVASVLTTEGYRRTGDPWTFKNTNLTLHRFLKVEQEDELAVDVLVAGSAEHRQMIEQADIAESKTLGSVRVVRRKDLVRLKQARFSKLDQADIEELEHDEG